MSAVLRAAGTIANGTTTVNPSYPAGGAANDLNILIVAVKPFNAGIPTPSGWTLVDTKQSGITASGVDSGSVGIAVFKRYGAFTGSLGAITPSSQASNTISAVIDIWHSDQPGNPPLDANLIASLAFENTTNFSVTTPNMGTIPTDQLLFMMCSQNSSRAWGPTWSPAASSGIYVSGDNANTSGNRLRLTDAAYTGWPFPSSAETITNNVATNPSQVNASVIVMRLTDSVRSAADTAIGTDAPTSKQMPISDTLACNDRMTRVPASRVWLPGDGPTADDVNRQWRDTFRLALGDSRPYYRGYFNGTPFFLNSHPTPIPMTVDEIKRNGMQHALGDSLVLVPESGWYSGVVTGSIDQNGFANWTAVIVNGTVISKQSCYCMTTTPQFPVMGGHGFTVYLHAGDAVQLGIDGSWGTNQVKPYVAFAGSNPRLEIWWGAREFI